MTRWHRGAGLALLAVGLWSLACSSGGGLPEPEDVEVGEHPAEEEVVEDEVALPEPGLGPLPLAVGHTWTWRVSERKGAGPRVFGFATKKPEHRVVADWTLSIEGEEAGKFEAILKRVPAGEELPTQTPMTLWEQDGLVWMDVGRGAQPALEIALPPDPVSAEQVRCVAHVLGGVVGRCAARPGGAMGAVPGLEEGIVAQDLKPGAEVGQFLVGLMSVGMFIPGNQSKVQTASRTGFTPGPGTEADFQARPGPVVAHVMGRGIEARKGLERALEEHGVDAEQGAAVVARIRPEDRLEAARLVLRVLPEDQRYPVVRTALALVPSEGPLHTLAALRGELPAEVPEVLAGTDGPFDHDRIEALDTVLPGQQPTLDDAVSTVSLCKFDDGRREAIDRLLPTFDPAQQPRAVAAMSEEIAFDDGKLELYRDHAEVLKTLPPNQREELAQQCGFKKDEARQILGLSTE